MRGIFNKSFSPNPDLSGRKVIETTFPSFQKINQEEYKCGNVLIFFDRGWNWKIIGKDYSNPIKYYDKEDLERNKQLIEIFLKTN